MRFLGGAVLITATMLALTGCGSQATEPTRTATVTVAPTTGAPTATPTPSATAAATASATPAPSTSSVATDSGRPANQCTDLGITVVADVDGGGAGHEGYRVLFTNTGGAACALRGTPGVSVVGDGNGTQLGKPADRVQTGVETLTLQAGDTVQAPLSVVNIGTNGGPLEGCTVQKGDGYRVYPPHSTRSYLFADPTAVACVKGPVFMTVGPVVPRTR